ncbi:MAG: hypothetical protein LAT55_01830 [Opitutales bacterium]|nr:hypothetical protein [Opitutales bacterium]
MTDKPTPPPVDNEPAVEKLSLGPDFAVQLIDRLLGLLGKFLTVSLFHQLRDFSGKIAHWAVLVFAALAIISSLLAAVKMDSFALFAGGFGLLVAIIVLQYTSAKFLYAGTSLIRSTPTGLSSKAFTDCFALVFLLAALGSLFGGISSAFAADGLGPVIALGGVVGFVGFGLLCWLCLQPEITNTKIGKEVSSGEEAIGIVSFLIKGLLALVPFIFTALVTLGSVALLLYSFLNPGASNFREHAAADAYGLIGVQLGVGGLLLPFVSVLLFLLIYLIIDIVRSVLTIPHLKK